MSGYRTVILEVGAILDSNDGQASAWTRALRNAGYPVSFADVRERIGMDCDRLLESLSGLAPGSAAAERIHADRRHLFQALHLANVTVLSGARDLIARLHREGHSMLLTSSAEPDETFVRELLEHTQLLHSFDGVVIPRPAERSMTERAVVLAALERSGTPAEEAMLIGDTPYDVAAASSVGVASLAFESGGWPGSALAGAVATYRDPLDLLSNFDVSPLSRTTLFERALRLPTMASTALVA